jgi:hypothetical protein
MCTENAVRALRVAFEGDKSSRLPLVSRRLAAAYEVDDFIVVAGLNGSIGPLRAREDFEVAFNGDASGGKIQVAQ